MILCMSSCSLICMNDASLLGTISNAGFVCEFKSAFDGVLCLAHEEGGVVHLLGSDNGV